MTFFKQFIKQIFQCEAKLILKKYKPKIIAITGSVGKTLVKDALYTMLSNKFFIRKSQKSFTAHLGIPLSIIGHSIKDNSFLDWFYGIFVGLWVILKRAPYPEWLILEIDGDKPGDIFQISRFVKPDLIIVTTIGETPAHIEYFNSDLDFFMKEEGAILDALKRGGVIFYDNDDENSRKLAFKSECQKISCGFLKNSNIYSLDFNILSESPKNKFPTGMFFEIFNNKETISVSLNGTVGYSGQLATIFASAVALHLGVSVKEIEKISSKIAPIAGRMRIVQGIKETLIIDDSYNSSPVALKQSVESVNKIKNSGRKIFVIGDMLELGKMSSNEHKKIAELIFKKADLFIFVGIRSKNSAESLLSLGVEESKVFVMDNAYEVGNFLQNEIREGDLVLVKGSQNMRMEKVVEEIMAHPENKTNLLVRQDGKWQDF